nr:zinc finger protein with KRAB and SCAN domains 1-like [Caretta caretta]
MTVTQGSEWPGSSSRESEQLPPGGDRTDVSIPVQERGDGPASKSEEGRPQKEDRERAEPGGMVPGQSQGNESGSPEGQCNAGRLSWCQDCGRSFHQSARLLRHQAIRTGERAHKRPDCGKGFTLGSDVTRHQRVHTGERPYACPGCGKGIAHSSDLIRHQSLPTEEKPYKRPACGKGFRVSSHLVTHQRVHVTKWDYS